MQIQWGSLPIIGASYNGHLEVVKALLAVVGIDVNAKGNVGGWSCGLTSSFGVACREGGMDRCGLWCSC